MAFTFSLFIAPLADEFRWSRTTISLGFSAMTLTLAFSAPVAGRLFDRWGVRRALMRAIPLFALSVGLMSTLAPSIPLFLLLFAVAGVLGAGQSPIPYVKLISQWFDRRRGLALGVAMSGIGLGGLILTQVVRVLLDRFGWRSGFAGLGIAIFAIGFPAVVLLVREPMQGEGGQAAPAAGAEASGSTLAEALRDFRFWAILVFVFFLTMTLNGVAAHAVPLLVSQGIARGEAASMLAALALSSLIGRLVTGYVLDRIFAPHIAALICVLALLGIALLQGETGAATALTGLACLGFSLGAETDVMGYLVGRYFGLRRFGELVGCMFGTFALAAAAGVPLMGLSHDLTRSYSTTLGVFAVGLIVAIAAVLRLGPYTFSAAAH